MLERDIWVHNNDYLIKIYDVKPEPHWIEEFTKRMVSINLQDFRIREELEKRFENLIQRNVLMTNSGTASLILSMLVHEWGDAEIIGPNFGNPAWVNACRFVNHKPVFVDIDKFTLCLSPDKIEDKITEKTKAIVFVNHGGYNGSDVLKVRDICNEHNLVMIEDSCNAFGYAGNVGDFSMFSFSSPKIISAGEGGCITMKESKYFYKLKRLIYQGGWYDDEERSIKHKGANFNLSPILCHWIDIQLDDMVYTYNKKEELKKKYIEYGVHSSTNIDITLITEKAKEIHKYLEKYKIQSVYRNYQPIEKIGDYPNSWWACENTIQLPFSYQMTNNQVQLISKVVRRFL